MLFFSVLFFCAGGGAEMGWGWGESGEHNNLCIVKNQQLIILIISESNESQNFGVFVLWWWWMRGRNMEKI